MEGPTPVSSLLHAATMVTAGVFLILRSSLFFEYCSHMLNLLCIFGSITALFSGLVASFQNDLKRIIAYSTCSQLGYMFLSCGLSNYHVAFFHLFTHAFFKALLFLSAGALIHSLFDEQDLRKIGSLHGQFPLLYVAFMIGSLAILGFPFLSGFYSKEMILELIFSRYIFSGVYLYTLALLAAVCTAIYSAKVLYYVFFSPQNVYHRVLIQLVNTKAEHFDKMSISMSFLCFMSILSGYLFSDLFLGIGTSFFNNSITVFIDHFFFLGSEMVPASVKNLPLSISLVAIYFIYYLLKYNSFFFNK